MIFSKVSSWDISCFPLAPFMSVYIYNYIYMCVCVCGCISVKSVKTLYLKKSVFNTPKNIIFVQVLV